MRAETVKKPGPGAYVGCALGGAAVALAVCLVLHFAVSKPASDKRIAELDRAVAGADGHAAELDRRVDEQKARIGELDKSLREAQAEITRLSTPLKAAVPTGPTVIKKGGGGPNTTVKPPLDSGPPCAFKGDPLCGHIDRN